MRSSGVELRAGVEDDHLVARRGEAVGDDGSGRTGADDTHVGSRDGFSSHDGGPRW